MSIAGNHPAAWAASLPDRPSCRNDWQRALMATSLRGRDRMVAVCLTTWADFETGHLYPTMDLISGASGYSRKTVRQALQGLRAAGVLDWQESRGRKPHRLRLIWAAIARSARATNPAKVPGLDREEVAELDSSDHQSTRKFGKPNPEVWDSQPGRGSRATNQEQIIEPKPPPKPSSVSEWAGTPEDLAAAVLMIARWGVSQPDAERLAIAVGSLEAVRIRAEVIPADARSPAGLIRARCADPDWRPHEPDASEIDWVGRSALRAHLLPAGGAA